MMFKSASELAEAWTHIVEKRRLGDPDDGRAIDDRDRLASMRVAWQRGWIESTEASASSVLIILVDQNIVL